MTDIPTVNGLSGQLSDRETSLMNCIFFLFAIPGHPGGILNHGTWDRFQLVEKVGARDDPAGRAFAKRVLLQRPPPDAWIAVAWGSRHRNAEIANFCQAVLEEWELRKSDPDWRLIVKDARGEFDGFLNSILMPTDSAVELRRFEKVAQIGRAFSRFMCDENSCSLNPGDIRSATIFQGFSRYLKQNHPVFLRQNEGAGERRSALISTKTWKGSSVFHSIILADGDIDIIECSHSIVIAGGDVRLKDLGSSIILAAGDVQVRQGGGLGPGLVIAGGAIRVPGLDWLATGVVFVTPVANELSKSSALIGACRVHDGKAKPSPEFFAFRELWSDYGVELTLSMGHLKITRTNTDGPFKDLFKHGDLVVARRKLKINSIGQFRRLLSHSLDTGEFEFEIERGGRNMVIRADLKKKQL